MNGRLELVSVGKQFQRRSSGPPRTIKGILSGGFRREHRQRFWAVRGVTATVEAGEVLGVLGRNGSGKSTLLRMLGGVMKPDEGHLTCHGRLHGLLELNSGVHPDLSGRENAIISGVVAGLTRQEILSRLDEIVDFAELEDFIDSPIRTYSSGMRLRLGFAVAIHTNPDVLLIDEVLSVGDLAFQAKCLSRVKSIKQAGCAIVLISHDLNQLRQVCDQALWLDDGQVRATGSPEAVVSEYRSQIAIESRRRGMAKLSTAGDAASAEDGEERSGSGEAEIAEVIFEVGGDPARSMLSGESLTLRILLRSGSPLESPHLTVSIGRVGEDECLDVSTQGDGAVIDTLDGALDIALTFDRLDLAAGEYWFSFGIYEKEWRYAYDYRWRGFSLVVYGPGQAKTAYSPPRAWKLGTNEDHIAIPTAKQDRD